MILPQPYMGTSMSRRKARHKHPCRFFACSSVQLGGAACSSVPAYPQIAGARTACQRRVNGTGATRRQS